jgi:leader peptidase (prepilin peptidase) / N-methyltransferase
MTDPEMILIPWSLLLGVFTFLVGACIGSFLNVCIFRIPRGLSVVQPRSFCPACKQTIPWYHNIPLLSYVVLRGRCSNCRAGITPRYWVVEILTAGLFVLTFMKFSAEFGGPYAGTDGVTDWRLIPVYWLMVGGLLLGTFVDCEHLIIPDRVTWGGMVAGLVLSTLVPSMQEAEGPLGGLLWSAVGAGAGFGILWLVAFVGRLVFRREAMGFGDVKLLGAIGAFLGWKAVVFTLVVSSFFGSVVGIGLVLAKQKRLQSRIPYGPYLAVAAIVWMLWGRRLLQFYMDTLMPLSVPGVETM